MKAQEASAAEDMIEELEDGGGMIGTGGTPNNQSNPKNKEQEMSIREQQLAAIQANIMKGLENPPPDDSGN